MENCPKCNEKLNIDEKSAGRCFSCGATFTSPIPKDTSSSSVPYIKDDTTDNTVAKVVRVTGIIIIILGTIGSIIVSNNQSSSMFLVTEFASIVSGIFFIGLAEIIKLLEEIKNKK